jgi:uncharacterized protein (TIGR02145 family)
LSEPEFSEFWEFSELFKPSTTEVRMNSLKLVLLTATFMFAMAFTFSCSSGDDDEGGDNNGGGNSVTIGTQTWMAKNLNVDVPGSKCYDNQKSNCDKYGRLYDWATAKTVCPFGWHLPSDDDWDVLVNSAGGSSTAGKHLKATRDWNDNGNGLDTYDFSAIPGGGGNSGGYFSDVGYYGYWWSSTEGASGSAYIRNMDYDSEGVDRNSNDKDLMFSVRCVQD